MFYTLIYTPIGLFLYMPCWGIEPAFGDDILTDRATDSFNFNQIRSHFGDVLQQSAKESQERGGGDISIRKLVFTIDPQNFHGTKQSPHMKKWL